jgi:hypothetical protein
VHLRFLLRPALGAALALALVQTAAPVVRVEIPANHVYVPVTAGGRPASFILDTGAASSYLDLAVARTLGAQVASRFDGRGAGPGTVQGGRFAAPIDVVIATSSAPVTLPVMQALDFSGIATYSGRSVDGVLGADFIRRFVLEIDYDDERLVLHSAAGFTHDGLGVTLPLTFRNGFPHVRAALRLSATESIEVDAVLDVGSSQSVIVTRPVAERHRLADRLKATPPIPTGRGVGGAAEARLARLPGLGLGSIVLEEPIVALAGPGSGVLSDDRLFEINIGGDVFRRFSVFFDYAQARVTFVPNGRLKEPFETDMSGLRLATEGAPFDRWVVDAVIAGSAAAAAGIRAGDRVLAIDGRRVADLRMSDVRSRLRREAATIRFTLERGGRTLEVTLTTRRIV